MSRIRFAAVGLLPLLIGVAPSCSSSPPAAEPVETTTSIGQSIMGGEEDPNDPAVVGIVIVQGLGAAICSGSLIAPNLVLTARHCVASTQEQVICSSSTFGNTFNTIGFFVTPDWNGPEQALQNFQFNGTWWRVSNVWVPDEDPVCGYDIALIELNQNVDGTVAPITPRVDTPPATGEAYRAVGYGATGGDGGGSGRRRTLDGLSVLCATSCNPSIVDPEREWVGSKGICQGDSGGPALDSQGQVFGVVSRGSQSCNSPVYESVYAWRDWIRAQALQAATDGDYDPAPWVLGPQDAGSDAPADAVEEPIAPADVQTEAAPDAVADSPTEGASLSGLGASCSSADQCESHWCVIDSDGSYYCSEPCGPANSCPTGYVCDQGNGSCYQGRLLTACSRASDCLSNVCVQDSTGQYCSQACSDARPCPEPLVCSADYQVCTPPPTAVPEDSDADGGCATGGPARGSFAMVLILGLTSALRRWLIRRPL